MRTWSRHGLWDRSARGVLLDLPCEVSDLCDLWDEIAAERAAHKRRLEEQRELVTRLLGRR